MIEPKAFQDLRLCGGFTIVQLEFAAEPLVDAVDRPALAKTRIVGHKLHIAILSGLSKGEKSVSLYHEVLEALTVACIEVPPRVADFNEADFERAAYQAHE
jgi:hypothetical protein